MNSQALFGNVNLKTNKWRTKLYWKPISENTSMNNRNLLGIPWTPPTLSGRFNPCQQRRVGQFFCAQTAVARPWRNCEIRAASHDSTTTPGERWFQANNSSPLIWLDLKFTAFKAGLACWSRLNKKKGIYIVGGSFFQHLWKKTCTCEIGNHLLDRFGGKTNQRTHLLVLLGKKNLWNHLLVC